MTCGRGSVSAEKTYLNYGVVVRTQVSTSPSARQEPAICEGRKTAASCLGVRRSHPRGAGYDAAEFLTLAICLMAKAVAASLRTSFQHL